jgi:hypothetical protein
MINFGIEIADVPRVGLVQEIILDTLKSGIPL